MIVSRKILLRAFGFFLFVCCGFAACYNYTIYFEFWFSLRVVSNDFDLFLLRSFRVAARVIFFFRSPREKNVLR